MRGSASGINVHVGYGGGANGISRVAGMLIDRLVQPTLIAR